MESCVELRILEGREDDVENRGAEVGAPKVERRAVSVQGGAEVFVEEGKRVKQGVVREEVEVGYYGEYEGEI